MSITQSRINREEKKRKKISKRTMIGIVSVALLLTSVAGVAGFKIYNQWSYGKAQIDKNAFKGKIAELPAEFAKNNISADMIDDVNSIREVKQYINQAQANGGLTDSNIKAAKSAYAKSKKILEHYKLIAGEAKQDQDLLDLYIQAYDISKNAYTSLDSNKLSDIITKISTRVIEHNNDGDKKILDNLNNIANDYTNLNNFIDTYASLFGTVDKNTVTLELSVTRGETKEMRDAIAKNDLTKFKNIEKLDSLLASKSWNNAIKKNDAKKSKDSFDTIEQAFKLMTKSQYIKAGDITTYADAVNAGFTVYGVTERKGYLINDNSPVKSLTIDGVNIKSSQYIRKGTAVIATINPNYKIDPNYKYSSSSSSSSSSSKSSSSTSKSSSSSSSSSSTSSSQTIPGLTDTPDSSSSTWHDYNE